MFLSIDVTEGISQINEIMYFIEMRADGEAVISIPMRRLSSHGDAEKRNSEHADRKYFERMICSHTSDSCWIKIMERGATQTVEFWGSCDPQILHSNNSTTFNITLDTNPRASIMMPSKGKWEIIVDPETRTMVGTRLNPVPDHRAEQRRKELHTFSTMMKENPDIMHHFLAELRAMSSSSAS